MQQHFVYFKVNFCPAMTGVADVDFDVAFPQIAQAMESSTMISRKQHKVSTCHLLCMRTFGNSGGLDQSLFCR